MGKSNKESKAASIITGRKSAGNSQLYLYQTLTKFKKEKKKLPHINGLY
jgi:hypothetical protein